MGGYRFSSSQHEELTAQPGTVSLPQPVKKACKAFFLIEGGSLSSQEGGQLGNLQ